MAARSQALEGSSIASGRKPWRGAKSVGGTGTVEGMGEKVAR